MTAKRHRSVEARLLSLKNAGIYLGISYWSARGLVESGKLKAVRLGPKMIRVEKSALDALIESCRDD